MATAPTAVHDPARRHRRGQAYVALAALAWSTAGVLQRQLSVDTATQVPGRAFFATIALLAHVAIAERTRVVGAFRSEGHPARALSCLCGGSSSLPGRTAKPLLTRGFCVVRALCRPCRGEHGNVR
jgi:hypothetical protein